ncbi:sigma-70 family RNA polymerase sigma factor [Spirosoma sp.]|uniref:RNA polymerase sigma factor n=1 Tax=Spirosoma sp. TaxID=1899569 RepID=UPI0026319FAD|nr:sigma-70 family RNA polymerase sigma factor [Spirosoma sp.]MCX6215288.1 sigma-70 family RNA polymerase sigma factor [Spirosoma sp.]
MVDERELVARVLRQDYNAFEELVNQYQQLVLYVVFRLAKNQQDREDICQEVFIKVHKNLHRFAFESKLSTWIATIAYQTAINYIKKFRREPVPNEPLELDSFYFTEETPEQLLGIQDEREYLHQLILQMPLHYRTVLTLYHLNEFSLAEIQGITGIPEGTLKSYLFRARQLLKTKLSQHR